MKKLIFPFVLGVLLLSIFVATAAEEKQFSAFEPSFSPDGTQLVFRVNINEKGKQFPLAQEIWTINRDGTNARRLTHGEDDRSPRFSPDGRNIAFTRAGDIWLIDADGGNLRKITTTNLASENQAEFTADGNLVFIRQTSTRNEDDVEIKDELLEGQLFALIATRRQSVVWHSLENGTEKVLLGDGYQVDQLSPHPTNPNQIFILCRPIDKTTRKPLDLTFPETTRRIIAVITPQGDLPHVTLEPESKDDLQITQFRVSLARHIYAVAPQRRGLAHTALWKKGKFVLLPNAPLLRDISRDGKTLVGIDHNSEWPSSSGITLYDIKSKISQDLPAPNFK